MGYFSGTNIERKLEKRNCREKKKNSFIFVEWDLFDFRDPENKQLEYRD